MGCKSGLISALMFMILLGCGGLYVYLDVRKEQLRQRKAIDKELILEHSENAQPTLRRPNRPPRLPETDEEIVAEFFDVNVLDETSYPEYEAVKQKPNVGLCFSGGGSRSFEATLGYLRGLLDADLLKYVRYLSSVSGGSWANAVFSYHDEDVVTLEELLGTFTPPEKITASILRGIPLKSARGFPVRTNLVSVVLGELLIKGTPPEDIWVKAIHETFLRKAGISIDALPAWNRQNVAKTLAQNPDLLNHYNFRVPCSGRANCDNIPFPIMNNAMLGEW
jgi:hypothetical protein